MKKALQAEGDKEGHHDEALTMWDCGSPLYDSCELASLSHLIERHLMTLPSLGGSRRFITQFSHPSDLINPSTSTVDVSCRRLTKWSSMVASLSEFVERKVWKKRVFGERKDKLKKMKLNNKPLGSCNKIGF
ncbi:hypothetical protein FNV43_RR18171 [Rhamnella rubrinervis]|uniref:Uncharacterized protein n=1 Tax=Rhamnella rubrinervis TaxID=2594499 RepID=A0A8K0E4N6_9ROSA|nr:hypothetical protein FNV43_RR18171 [Rhamnella rubrinervis]